MIRVFASLGLALSSVSLSAADTKASTPAAADPDLPQPLDLNVAAPLLESSPFTRALDLSDSLMLTGIAYVKGRPVVTLANKATQERYVVSEEPNALGWRLMEASPATELRFTQAKLMVGTETITVRYSEAQLTPTAKGFVPGGRTPTEQEYMRKDENGKAYVSGSVYLSEADHDRYRNSLSKEAHDRFREIIRDSRDKMFSMSATERADFAKKVLDKVDAEDKTKKK
jgi:hypothetical protein